MTLSERCRTLVDLALEEDIGPGDVTTRATIPEEARSSALVLARESGVLSGLAAAREVARQVDAEVSFQALCRDGHRLRGGDEKIAILEGATRSLLSMERVLLNFLQRLSGVATLTSRFVERTEGTGAVIVDTRKTTPGFRELEKEAVLHGGGRNHRLGLWDAYMIKDNHIQACGGLTAAVRRVREGRQAEAAGGPGAAEAGDPGPAEADDRGAPGDADRTSAPRRLRLIVEARTEAEVAEAAGLSVDQILLDNMTPNQLAAAVRRIRAIEDEAKLPRARIEASGGINLANVREVALSGVDVISIGALTHSAPALDLAMKIDLPPPGRDRTP